MGRTSSPSGNAASGPWCTGTNVDGKACGNRVPTYGSLCAAHRRAAERRRQTGRAPTATIKDDAAGRRAAKQVDLPSVVPRPTRWRP